MKSRIEKMVPHTAGGDDIFVQIADGGFVMFDAHANVPAVPRRRLAVVDRPSPSRFPFPTLKTQEPKKKQL